MVVLVSRFIRQCSFSNNLSCVPPAQAPPGGNLMDGLIGSSSMSNNLMNGSAGKYIYKTV